MAHDIKLSSQTALDNYDFRNIKKFHSIQNDDMDMEEKNDAIKKILELYI